jgi:diguanylate cyclase (GGDEF)-like protein
LAHRDFLRTETLRLAALRAGDLFNTPLETRFNRLARLARRALNAQASTISLFDGEREWIKATDGTDWPQLQHTPTLGATVARRGLPVIVEDTHELEGTRQHPVVAQFPNIRFCAAFPLLGPNNEAAGVVAAYDCAARRAGDDLTQILADVGQLAQRELSISEGAGAQEELLRKLSLARREALIDELTRVWNRRGGLQLLEDALSDAPAHAKGLGVCIADLDRFKELNDKHGHQAGDVLLRKAALILVDSVRPADVVARLGGEEFLLVIPNVSATELSDVMERVRKRIAALPLRTRTATAQVTISIGGCLHDPEERTTAEDLLRRADDALYQAKAAGRDVVVLT